MPRPKSIAPVPQVHCRLEWDNRNSLFEALGAIAMYSSGGYCGYLFPLLALYQTAMSPAHVSSRQINQLNQLLHFPHVFKHIQTFQT